MMRINTHKITRIISQFFPKSFLAFALLLQCGLFTAQQVHAISEETYHAQNLEEGAQTHAEGTPANYEVPFWERYAPPESISSFGHRLDWLFAYTSWTAFVFFVIMCAALGYFIIRYRERPGHKPYYTHGKSSSSEKWAPKMLDLAVFVSLDLVLIGSSYIHTKEFIWDFPQGDNVVKVQVMPQQWAWNFRYAGKDGLFNTADDITTVNDMRIPVNQPVVIQMKAKDVIHGFMIPEVRSQIDAIPGSVTRFWFDTNREGDFEIACMHLCGTAHYKMKAFLTVMDQQDYKDWNAEASDWAKAMHDPDDPSLAWGWNWEVNDQPLL